MRAPNRNRAWRLGCPLTLYLLSLVFAPDLFPQSASINIRGAVKAYFADHGRWLAWPTFAAEPKMGDIGTDRKGSVRVVRDGCFGSLKVKKESGGPYYPYAYRAFHRGGLPPIAIDFTNLQPPQQQPLPAPQVDQTGGDKARTNSPVTTGMPQGAPPPGLGSAITAAILSSIGHILIKGREPLDIYIEFQMHDPEIESVAESTLLEQVRGPDFPKACLATLQAKNHFVITGVLRGRIRLQVAQVLQDRVPSVLAIGAPPGWVRNADGSVEMKEPRVLAFSAQVPWPKEKVIRGFDMLPNKQWRRIYAGPW